MRLMVKYSIGYKIGLLTRAREWHNGYRSCWRVLCTQGCVSEYTVKLKRMGKAEKKRWGGKKEEQCHIENMKVNRLVGSK